MAEATDTASADATDPDKKLRARVDKLLAQPASDGTGSIRLGGKALHYAVRAEFLPVVAEGFDGATGEPQAAVMATSYVLAGTTAAARPVCFAFNGGPGSASIWLHLGALGPKRVVTPDDGSMPHAPFAVSDNPHSWFEHLDLVFIDPPHTGWSVCTGAEARKKMLSVDGDVDALAEVVRVWLTRHKRWGSPVYLAGESYGTTRGAALADKLQSAGVSLSGLILVSCAMDLQSIVFAPANDLPYSLFLPAFANVSQYHGLLKGTLAKSPAEAARGRRRPSSTRTTRRRCRPAPRLDGKRRNPASPGRIAVAHRGCRRRWSRRRTCASPDRTVFRRGPCARRAASSAGSRRASTAPQAAMPRRRPWSSTPASRRSRRPTRWRRWPTSASSWAWSPSSATRCSRSTPTRPGTGTAATTRATASPAPAPTWRGRCGPATRICGVFVASGRYDLGHALQRQRLVRSRSSDVPAAVLARVQHFYYDAGHMMYTREADLSRLKSDLARLAG